MAKKLRRDGCAAGGGKHRGGARGRDRERFQAPRDPSKEERALHRMNDLFDIEVGAGLAFEPVGSRCRTEEPDQEPAAGGSQTNDSKASRSTKWRWQRDREIYEVAQ